MINMTGEIHEEMCGREYCEICELLNDLFSKLEIYNISILSKQWEKYGKLFYHNIITPRLKSEDKN